MRSVGTHPALVADPDRNSAAEAVGKLSMLRRHAGLPVSDEIGASRFAAMGSAIVCGIGAVDPSGDANGLAKGIANSNELFGTACPAALRPTISTIPISVSPYRIARLSRTSVYSIHEHNLTVSGARLSTELIIEDPVTLWFRRLRSAISLPLAVTSYRLSDCAQLLTPLRHLLLSSRWLTTSAYPEWLRVQAL